MDENRRKRFAKIWWKSRADAGATQERLATALGVSRKTIQNWETGETSPTLFQGTEWFHALGLNPLPYYLEYVFPDVLSSTEETMEEKELDRLLSDAIHSLPFEAKKRIMFLLLSEHGSSPSAILNLVNAYLQLPMNDRYKISQSIRSSYLLESELDNLVCPDKLHPDMDELDESIELSRKAILSGDRGYSMAKD